MNELDYPDYFPTYPTDSPDDFELDPEGDYEIHRDEKGQYHNDKGPAYISETEVGFATHGKDWEKEKYQTYIIKCLEEHSPETDITKLPFAQIESIVYALKGWGRRKILIEDFVSIAMRIIKEEGDLQKDERQGGLL